MNNLEYEDYVYRYADVEAQITLMKKHKLFKTRYYTSRKQEFCKALRDLEKESDYYLNKIEEIINKKEPV